MFCDGRDVHNVFMTQHISQIAHAIDFIVANYRNRPSLNDLAREAKVSPAYFQKIFQAHVGLSPLNLCRYLHYKHARDLLSCKNASTLDVALEAGLSGGSRLHDLMITYEAVSPGDISTNGKNLKIYYGMGQSYMGHISLACTQKGLCWLGFHNSNEYDPEKHLKSLRHKWPKANFVHSQNKLGPYVEKVNKLMSLTTRTSGQKNKAPKNSLNLHVFGTNFQIQIWQALLQVGYGQVTNYGDMAKAINKPRACRAVGQAVGQNPIAVLIPCHRVIQSNGIVENYAWGDARKKLLLLKELHNRV